MTDAREARPMVSVAMIAYNKADTIAEAIRGVLRQKTDFPVELIIVDDCSSDRTFQIASEFQSRYPEIIKLYHNRKNLGLQRNYIEAFSHCRGKYLAICDADDYWCYPGKLRRQVSYMENNPGCAITFHRVINYYEADSSKSLSNGGQKIHTTISDLSRSNYITNLSVVYRRELVDLTDLPSWIAEDKSPDYAMHMLYAAHGYIHYFPRPMGVYRLAAGSSWSVTERYTRLKMSLSVREHLIETFAHDSAVTIGLRQASANILLHMIIAAEGDSERTNFATTKLLQYSSYSTAEAIDAAIAQIRNTRPTLKKRLLTPTRALISRLIPLRLIAR